MLTFTEPTVFHYWWGFVHQSGGLWFCPSAGWWKFYPNHPLLYSGLRCSWSAFNTRGSRVYWGLWPLEPGGHSSELKSLLYSLYILFTWLRPKAHFPSCDLPSQGWSMLYMNAIINVVCSLCLCSMRCYVATPHSTVRVHPLRRSCNESEKVSFPLREVSGPQSHRLLRTSSKVSHSTWAYHWSSSIQYK